MSTELDPIIENWYRHLDKGQLFHVVAFDEASGTIELQHFDGDIEEIELPAWYDMTLELAEAPEDWTGPVDDVELDDLSYTETDMAPADWRKPLEETPGPSREPWEDTRPEDERDEWAEGMLAEDLQSQQEIDEGAAPSSWSEAQGPTGEEEEPRE